MELCASQERYLYLHGLLDAGEQNKAAKLILEDDRHQWVVAHGQMRLILALYVGMKAQDIPLIQKRGEKPFIQDSMIKFNLSHSKGYALLAVTNTGEVGIDIEFKRENIKLERTSHSTFSAIEKAEILEVEGAARVERFYNCWTRKEAFIKAIGLGFSYDTKSFTLTVKENERPKFVRFERQDYDPSLWSLLSFVPYPNTQAALAFAFTLTAIHYLELSEPAVELDQKPAACIHSDIVKSECQS
ncbi:MAG: 4'-phosphopantetheinyl transferase superfamily protein [Legionellaceae bacterium]|nr:4'-phosphopantetheinyl transferase superfamily protein [Legionellaceae bacterium]